MVERTSARRPAARRTRAATEVTITYRKVRRSTAIEADIRERFGKLRLYCPSILGGRVVVERSDGHHRDGYRYHVRIAVRLPGDDVLIEHKARIRQALRATTADAAHKQDEIDRDHVHAGVAIREAFEAARRRLQDQVQRRRGDVKTRAAQK